MWLFNDSLKYKSTALMVQISQGSTSTYFRWCVHFLHILLSVYMYTNFYWNRLYLRDTEHKIGWHVFWDTVCIITQWQLPLFLIIYNTHFPIWHAVYHSATVCIIRIVFFTYYIIGPNERFHYGSGQDTHTSSQWGVNVFDRLAAAINIA